MSRPLLCSPISRHPAPATLILAFYLWTAAGLWGQTNAIPFINQPLIPASIAPGSGDFTLKVKGTGFATGAVLKWNGSSRITIVDSPGRVRAKITASDIANAGTASITVVNPAPGGGTSNVVYFPVRKALSSVALARVDHALASEGGPLVAGDFNNDGKLDVAVGRERAVDLFLGKGKGGFESALSSALTRDPGFMVSGDFNNDGNLDLVYGGNLLLGDGQGHFAEQPFLGSGTYLGVGDLNQDGKLDVISGEVGNDCYDAFGIYLGNGDGTFTFDGHEYSQDCSTGNPAVGDFNRDGVLDLAVPEPDYSRVDVYSGYGDGTFQTPGFYDTPTHGGAVVTADLNGDGNLDLITSGMTILLGNGDGTFTVGDSITLNGPLTDTLQVGDLNGDGELDVAVNSFPFVNGRYAEMVELLLGNGDGTLQSPIEFGSGLFGGFSYTNSLATGDFNGDGKLDLVDVDVDTLQQPVFSVLLSTTASITPSSLDFGKQQIGQKSTAQVVTLKNIGLSQLSIDAIRIKGVNAGDFSKKNLCGSELAPGDSCSIKIFFEPAQIGTKSAFLKIVYGGIGSPQKVALAGTAIDTHVSLTPSKLTFPVQLVGTKSSPQTATLTNVGTEVVTITAIATTGPFIQSNNCGASLNPGASCQIQVQFTPTDPGDANGSLTVTDNAPDSPQQVALSGTGTIVKLSPLSINFGDQPVGTTSPAVPVTLTNKGNVTLNISAIEIVGTNAADFAQTNNCGNSVPPAGSCKIKVTFTPSAQGPRSASLSISDDGGGSPQTVALSGNGT